MPLFKIVSKLADMKKQGLFDYDKNLEQSKIDVPLEFVKCISKVLSLDPAINEGVERLRSQLFQIIQIDDMLPESFWTAPAMVCVLENIFCTQCNLVVDLDVNMTSTG